MSTAFPDEFPFDRQREVHPQLIAAPSPARQSNPTPDAFSSFALIDAASQPAPLQSKRIAPQPTGAERRRAVRQTLVARATIKPESNYRGCGPLAAGYVSNISLKGVGFHTRRPLLVGESYHLKLEVGPLKWQSRLRIVTCHPHDSGTYDIGAEFIANELELPAARGLAA